MGELNLQVDIDENSGFCFGVVEAIKKAEKALEDGGELYCLGEIVHNDGEVNRLESKGMKTITKEDLNKINSKTILFRAHGEPPNSYSIAKENNNLIIDASCPIIKKLQYRIKKSFDDGETILIFGKPNHPEVIALNGQIENQAIIFKEISELESITLPAKLTLYSQTTMSLDAFHEVVEFLKNHNIDVKVKDTICRKVSNRQPDIEAFCRKYNKVLFVAGRNSSNGKVLYNVCKSQNQNSYFISSVEEIKTDWFAKDDKIGISGATSTPKWLMEEVKRFLEKL